MLYLRGTWTLPAANHKTTQKNWDRAFLSKDDFESRYGKESFDEAQPENPSIPE